jgi:hypothetical protein
MRYPAAEKLESIRIVEQSHLSVRRTLEQIGVPIGFSGDFLWDRAAATADQRRPPNLSQERTAA